MIFIGVTGGIGSGKSTVCSLLEGKGVPVFYADTVAKDIIDNDRLVLRKIVKEFGPQVLHSQEKIDRKKLAEIVFTSEEQLQKLNEIVHPKVFEEFTQWKTKIQGSRNYALVEAALIFESGMSEMIDYVLAVIADEEERILRVAGRDRTTQESIKARMNHQISTEELLEISDFQIHNNGTIGELTTKVNFFHTLFSTLTSRKEIE